MNLKELKSLIRLLRKQGVTEFKSSEYELKLGDVFIVPRRTKKDLTESPIEAQPQYTEIDTLLWSAGGDPALGGN